MDITPASGSKRGGWKAFAFIIVAVAGMSLGSTGSLENLIVFFIGELNMKRITAAQITNVLNGCTCLFPVFGAIIADSFLGSFIVASISFCVALLGTVVLTLMATLNSLRPQPCDDGSKLCKPPSEIQDAVLYVGLTLITVGFGGVRFTIATFGASQFDKAEEKGSFFDWFFFTLYIASIVSMTAIFYIEGEVSWGVGFGLCALATLIAMVTLLSGYPFYRSDKPQGSPFLDLARVPVASVRKWKSQLSSRVEEYYGGHDGLVPVFVATPGKRLRFFNRAALINEGDIQSNGAIAKPWRLCTVKQVEDFKSLIGIMPLWSTSIFLSTSIGIEGSLIVLQALTMDRHLGSHFQIPPGSIPVILLVSTAISLPLIDRVLFPAWQKLIGKPLTPLHRIGIGHVFSVLSCAVSALIELKRLNIAHRQQLQEQTNLEVAMSALWLCPQLFLAGIGIAFHFPGQVAFYYQEFPESLKSTSTAMISLIQGIGYYMSTAVIDLVQRITPWLPDDINHGRLDNMYWALFVLGVLNFAYYLVCSALYNYVAV
ncbi:hypothetical protein L6164_021926 [Bauhinia variegata]|uniref:Uncharacterized protein n=1 Tax=Bauhinia variegata TaxID=167791 RepID=A0ACB9MD98_BAUVA|nr:hypothetical protein L6164_021926 [Bauhinia variegata]